MKTKNGFRLRKLGEDYILITEAVETIDFNKLISFNVTAAFLWEKFQGVEFTTEQMAEALIEKYNISKELAERDSKKLTQDWIDAGIIE